VFNGQVYVADALTSVAAQSVHNLEIIVVDDGSTDSTAKVVRAFGDGRVRYVHQRQSGAAAARNYGVDLARGELLAFLDADDLWTVDKLDRQIASLERADGDMIFANVEEFISPDRLPGLEGQVKPHSVSLTGVSIITLLVRREDFDKVGPFDARWHVGEFLDWYARAVDLGLKSAILPEVLARRRIHETNQGRQNRALRAQYAQVVKRILDRRRARH
jgi:glycosyltransferase involved in cell wall biosynthesis